VDSSVRPPSESGQPVQPQAAATAGGGSAYLIREDFFAGEATLGLVLDWSMPLPVISSVLPRSPAAKRPSLCYGLVLIAVSGQKLRAGQRRVDVESLLGPRPLELVFEAPDFALIGDATSAMWRQTPSSAPPEEVQMVSLASLATAEHGLSFFKRRPERIPLSRWGDLDTAPAPVLPLLWRPAACVKVPEQRRRAGAANDTALPPAHGASASAPQPFRLSKSPSDSLLTPLAASARNGLLGESVPGRGARGVKGGGGGAAVAAAGRRAEAAPTACDGSYAHVLEAGRPCGGGPPAEWPLRHEPGYVCRLQDLELVQQPLRAYEVGFRGQKRAPLTEMELHFPELATAERPKRLGPVSEISCDVCSLILATGLVQNPNSPSDCFYYCRECKSHGRRFEMCVACHAMAVLHSEGKHGGPDLHPHYSHCDHGSLAVFKDLKAAYPGLLHFRFAVCDHCGGRVGQEKSDVYICPRCPKVSGLRFELCATCAHLLNGRGDGISRLRPRWPWQSPPA